MLLLYSMVYAQGTCPTPGTPSNLSPSDGSTNISVSPALSWSACSNSDSYTVYFGTSSNPSYLGDTYNVNYPLTNLASNTTYYWRIVAINSCGNATVGRVWSFKTACLSPTTPSTSVPKDSAMVVGNSLSLGWTSSYADSYDVYFGTSSNPPLLGNSANLKYTVTGLSPNTSYYWRIVALSNCGGYSVSGPVWSFSTAPTNPYSSSNWTWVETPYVSSDWSLNSVHFTSADEGWAVGTDNQNNRGVLLHYLNGTWTSINPPDFSPSWELNSVHFTSSDEGWAVGTDDQNNRGVLLHYLNGTWTSINPPDFSPSWELNSVHFTLPDEGWAVGSEYISSIHRGVLLHYLNGVWTSVTPPNLGSLWELNSVHFTSADEGWAVGEGWQGPNRIGVLLHYLKGSWTHDHFGSSNQGWAVKEDAVSPIPMAFSYEDLNSVYFISPDQGWVVGTLFFGGIYGEAFHYSNGSWEGSDIRNNRGELNGVYFTSLNEGWVVGGISSATGQGVLLQYWYGDWEAVTPPDVSSHVCWVLNGVHFTSSDEGWAVGTENISPIYRGVLLKFSALECTYSIAPNSVTIGWEGESGSVSVTAGPNCPWTASTNSGSWDWLGISSGWSGTGDGTVNWYAFANNGTDSRSGYLTIAGQTFTVTQSGVGPDLTGEWDSLTQTCKSTRAGQKCTIKGTFTVSNIGNRDASSTYVEFYLSDNNIYEEGDVLLKRSSTGKIKGGRGKSIKFSYSFPLGQIVTGKYIIAVIDKDNSVAEINETNNIITYGPIL